MDCAPVPRLPDGSQWVFEIKLDGYRAIAVKADGRVNLFSRRRKSFDHHYPLIVEFLPSFPKEQLSMERSWLSTIQADLISTCSKTSADHFAGASRFPRFLSLLYGTPFTVRLT